jgi:hypothetical protein
VALREKSTITTTTTEEIQLMQNYAKKPKG